MSDQLSGLKLHIIQSHGGGGETNVATDYQTPVLGSIVPHPRTLRKAREQVKQMVIDGLSARRIRRYLYRWAMWWVRTTESWQYTELLEWFLNVCWDFTPAVYATGLLQTAINDSQDLAQARSTFPRFQATA